MSENRKKNMAIAYSVQRQGKKKKMAQGGELSAKDEQRASVDQRLKRSIDMLDSHELKHAPEQDARKESLRSSSIDGAEDEREFEMMRKRYARGGEIDMRDETMEGNSLDAIGDDREMDMLDSHPLRHKDERRAGTSPIRHTIDEEDDMELDMVSAIRRKMLAKGGEVEDDQVDVQDSNGDEHLNKEDQLSFEAGRKKTYYDVSQLSDQPEDNNEHGDDLESDIHDMVSAIRKKIKR